MNISKRTLIPYVLFGGAILLTIYYFIQAGNMRKQLQESKALQEQQEYEDSLFLSLSGADQLLLKGDYENALTIYRSQEFEDPELARELHLRIDLARRLINQRNTTVQPDSASGKPAEDTIQVIETITPRELKAYDSLRFALEKARVQNNHLKRQLAQRSAGSYLTLTSKKGNTMHYVGEVRNGQANGNGIALLTTGSRYVGEWKDNMRHGKGTFYWPDGEIYEGDFFNDSRSGQGTYSWPSGEKYVGQWANNQRNGEGVFYDTEGKILAKGIWKNDELIKQGK